MLLLELKKQFISRLKEEYPPEEVQSFFHILTEAYLGVTRLDLALNPMMEIEGVQREKFEEAMKRLKNHEPIQYITGKNEFCGYTFQVNEHVLIPRPETEELVQWIIDDEGKTSSTIKILDIGTGSGCIAVSLAKKIEKSRVSAIDVSSMALKVAKRNAEKNGIQVDFHQADVLQQNSLPGKYDIIVSNPPYVRELEKEKMQKNVLDHEPGLALYVKDDDPLIFYRKITKLAKDALNPNGNLYFEINQYLGPETEDILKEAGFKTELRKDIYGNHRMLKGKL